MGPGIDTPTGESALPHLVINGCIGPAVIRQYTEIQMKSDAVDERGIVYGDPLWI